MAVFTYLQGQKYPKEAFNAESSKAITNLPLAVLVNKELLDRLKL